MIFSLRWCHVLIAVAERLAAPPRKKKGSCQAGGERVDLFGMRGETVGGGEGYRRAFPSPYPAVRSWRTACRTGDDVDHVMPRLAEARADRAIRFPGPRDRGWSLSRSYPNERDAAGTPVILMRTGSRAAPTVPCVDGSTLGRPWVRGVAFEDLMPLVTVWIVPRSDRWYPSTLRRRGRRAAWGIVVPRIPSIPYLSASITENVVRGRLSIVPTRNQKIGDKPFTGDRTWSA